MKKLMYLSIAILCLSISALIGFHIGSQSVQATVATEPVGNIVAMLGGSVVTVDGKIWSFSDVSGQWIEGSHSPIPFSVENIHFIAKANDIQIVDKNGDVWNCSSAYQWTNLGHPPASSVPANQSTWGDVKNTYK